MPQFKSVCFVYPDRGEGSRFDRMFPPLGLEVVSAGIADIVADRCLIDFRFDEDWEALVPENADLAALSLLWDAPLRQMLDVSKRLKQMRPGITVVAGGRVAEVNKKQLVTAAPDERIDVVFSGPDDGRFRSFVTTGRADDIEGASYLEDGEYRETPPMHWGPIPDEPLPDRSMRRHQYGAVRKDGFSLGITTDAIQSSRGCPYHCSFCTFNRDSEGNHLAYTARTAQSVADEIAQMDADHIIFTDDNVCHDVHRMEELCDILLERGIKKTYGLETRVNIGMRPELVHKMAKAGFRHVTFGLESFDDEVLKFLKKDLKLRTIRTAFERIRGVDMLLIGNFIIGNVGETRSQMLQIPKLAHEFNLDSVQINLLRCRGPEPLTATVKATPGYYIDPRTKKVYSDENSLDDMSKIRRKIKKDFWTAPQGLRTFWRVWRLIPAIKLSRIAYEWAKWLASGKPDPWGHRAGKRKSSRATPATATG